MRVTTPLVRSRFVGPADDVDVPGWARGSGPVRAGHGGVLNKHQLFIDLSELCEIIAHEPLAGGEGGIRAIGTEGGE